MNRLVSKCVSKGEITAEKCDNLDALEKRLSTLEDVVQSMDKRLMNTMEAQRRESASQVSEHSFIIFLNCILPLS